MNELLNQVVTDLHRDKFKLGTRVETICDWPGVPAGTQGIVCEDYGSGITVAWDLPDRPLPDLPADEIAKLWAVDHSCPLRDGFDKETELQYLKVLS